MKRATLNMVLLAAMLAVAGPARADYLYSAVPDEIKPRIMLVVDTSGSMNDDDDDDGLDSGVDVASGACPYGADLPRNSGHRCYTRLEAAKAVLHTMLTDKMAGMEIGLIRFTTDPSQVKLLDPDGAGPSPLEPRTCGVCPLSDPTPDLLKLNDEIQTFVGNTWTPLAGGLDLAHKRINEVRAGNADLDGDGVPDPDPAIKCRPYYAIILTDGEETCGGDPVGTVKALFDDNVKTFVLGFGKEVAKSVMLTDMARAGGTSVEADQTMSCWGTNAPCTTGTALFAADTSGLAQALGQIASIILTGEFSVSAPILATIPFEPTELSRVRDNALVMGSFRKSSRDMDGHLYGLQLYYEVLNAGRPTGNFEAGDFTATDTDGDGSYYDLNSCGAPGNVCRYDAGKMLHDRVNLPGYATNPLDLPQDGKERVIYSGISSGQLRPGGGALTLQIGKAIPIPYANPSSALSEIWANYASIAEIASVLTSDRPSTLALDASLQPTAARLDQLGRWLHGDPAVRAWPLGDIYHSSAAVVGPPGLGYRNGNYPLYAKHQGRRAQMAYVGANDGMIHAFHAGPDLRWEIDKQAGPRWQAGEEAWAYLPVNMLARALMASDAGDKRFFSQDLSCRVDDVLVHSPPATDDPNYGWRTLLMCGQGWGGSWYVGIDVTEPDAPQFLWEFTDQGPAADGLGRTWSMPGIGMVNIGSQLTWVATFGGGENTDMQDCRGFNTFSGACTASGVHPAYRMLNQPFLGTFPEHGDGVSKDLATVYVVNFATGELIKRETGFSTLRAVLADVPVLDTDMNGLIDSAYVAGWNGNVGRLAFEGSGPASLDPKVSITASDLVACPGAFATGLVPLANKPAVALDPHKPERVYAFISSGLNAGSAPDEVRFRSALPGFRGFAFDDNGTGASCQPSLELNGVGVPVAGNICTDPLSEKSLALNGRERMLGAPLLMDGDNNRTWLSYVTWDPPPTVCQDGTALGYCVDVTDVGTCGSCVAAVPACTGADCCTGPDCCVGSGCEKNVCPAPPCEKQAPETPTCLTPPCLGPPPPPSAGGEKVGQPPPPNLTLPAKVLSWREVFN